mmetsp:Transcript_35506/g.48511  ORF Transcript_35506/g.48511 Transcript_35506/m.48511 type:complete len:97 (-) Transcript_35506:132-422(-)
MATFRSQNEPDDGGGDSSVCGVRPKELKGFQVRNTLSDVWQGFIKESKRPIVRNQTFLNNPRHKKIRIKSPFPAYFTHSYSILITENSKEFLRYFL